VHAVNGSGTIGIPLLQTANVVTPELVLQVFVGLALVKGFELANRSAAAEDIKRRKEPEPQVSVEQLGIELESGGKIVLYKDSLLHNF